MAYLAANVWQMKNASAEPEHEEELMGIGKIVLLLVVGAALIALGANLLVDNGTIIAHDGRAGIGHRADLRGAGYLAA